MNKTKAPLLPTALQVLVLSDPGYKALRRLQKGCAYRVHGAWRFRGSHSSTRNATLVVLLAKGLAELVDIGGHIQIRITTAGSAVRRAARSLDGKAPSPDHKARL